MDLDPTTQQNLNSWLFGSYDEETKNTIRRLLAENPGQIIDSFYTHLAFGTGGLRGIMGVGSNRINLYTVGAATQGLANYLKKQSPSPQDRHAVFIGYDSRHLSKDFAEEAAKILAGNDIEVYIFKELRPSPLVSFGCRYKKCSAAIMITASHNLPEYNGYKVFWKDGAQLLPPHDANIILEVKKIYNPSSIFKTNDLHSPTIHWIADEIDEAYLLATESLQNFKEYTQKEGHWLHVVFTSLHGTGITMVPKILKKWGFNHLSLVESQIIPDGNFPTVHSPNPEENLALSLGIQNLIDLKGDILIATDPDCDRLGVVALHENKPHILTGNQIACLCLYHLCETLLSQQRMSPLMAFVKTIVTTELFQVICDNYNKPCFNVLTGFKYVAEKINKWEENSPHYEFIFGGEESYGYLYGTHARDKDAIIISALICEAALQAKKNSQTLIDILHSLYKKFGYFHEKLHTVNFKESKKGREQMAACIAKIQENPPKIIGNIKIHFIEDYYRSVKINIKTHRSESLDYPSTAMILFWLEDGSKVAIRPSGTEPKIKIYCGTVEKKFESIVDAQVKCTLKANNIIEWLTNYLNKDHE